MYMYTQAFIVFFLFDWTDYTQNIQLSAEFLGFGVRAFVSGVWIYWNQPSDTAGLWELPYGVLQVVITNAVATTYIPAIGCGLSLLRNHFSVIGNYKLY